MRVLIKSALVAALALAAGNAFAAPVTYILNFDRVGGPSGTATGFATFDDSLLDGPEIFEELDKTGLDDFSMTVSGMVGQTGSTCFSLSDLSGWVLNTGEGEIDTAPQKGKGANPDNHLSTDFADLNFFMFTDLGDEGNVGIKVNGDGYGAIGVAPYTIVIVQGENGDPFVQEDSLVEFEMHPARATGGVLPPRCSTPGTPSTAIPTLDSAGMLLAILVLLLTGGLALRVRP